MHKTSKGYRRFQSRVKYFQEDLETAMVLFKNEGLLAGSAYIFENVSPNYQPCLSKRQNSSSSRLLVLGHMKKTLYIAFIKELYEEVMIYLSYAINCSALELTDATRLIGAQNNLQFKITDILDKSTKEEIFQMILDKVFRVIENKKDTLEMISTFNERLNLGVDEEIIDKSMPYLEMRHLFSHSDGVTDEYYRKKYPNISVNAENQIILNSRVITQARSAICALVLEYENKLKLAHCFNEQEFA